MNSDEISSIEGPIARDTYDGHKATYPYFLGFFGAASSLMFACLGASYGTAKAGIGVTSVGMVRPDLVMKSIIPCIMTGMIGIYGLIIAIMITSRISNEYSAYQGFAHMASGLSVGISGIGAGFAIGIVGDAGVRANAQEASIFTGMILILIFAEALALYGLIIGLVLAVK